MKLSIPALAAAAVSLAATAAADSMFVDHVCLLTECSAKGYFTTSFGTFEVNTKDGCRTSGVPYMNEFCIDEKRGRMHFRFNQQNKRCMKVTSSDWELCNPDFVWSSCSTDYYTEVPCTW